MPVKGKLMHSWVKRVTVLLSCQAMGRVACRLLLNVTGDTYHLRLGTSAHFRVGVRVRCQ